MISQFNWKKLEATDRDPKKIKKQPKNFVGVGCWREED